MPVNRRQHHHRLTSGTAPRGCKQALPRFDCLTAADPGDVLGNIAEQRMQRCILVPAALRRGEGDYVALRGGSYRLLRPFAGFGVRENEGAAGHVSHTSMA